MSKEETSNRIISCSAWMREKALEAKELLCPGMVKALETPTLSIIIASIMNMMPGWELVISLRILVISLRALKLLLVTSSQASKLLLINIFLIDSA